jgi:hypothetical protein
MKLILALVSLLAVPVQQEEELEVIFVVDSSNSMKRNDPKGLRTQIAGIMVDFLGKNRAVTVSVVQFAGWNESQKEKVVLLSRKTDRKEIASSLENLSAFGDASDINVAFEIGIPRILQAREKAGTKGPLWIVILTDGEFDVIEESDIRPIYETLAERDFPQLYEEEPDVALNRAALRILSSTLRKEYRDIPLIVSGINLGREKVDDKSTFHKLVTLEGRQEGRVLQVEKSVLLDVVVPLLMQSPDWKKGRETFYGYRPPGKTREPFHVYPGSVEAEVVAWGPSPDYKIDVTSGESRTFGEGNSHRLISLEPSTPGDRNLALEGAAANGVETIFHIVTGLKPVLRRTGDGNLGKAGRFRAEAGVVDAEGKAVSGETLTAALTGTATLTPPAGAAFVSPLRFEPEGIAPFDEAVAVDPVQGRYRLECALELKLPGALHILPLGKSSEKVEFLVLPTYTATFEKGETWTGEKNTLRVDPAPEETVRIALVGPGNPSLSVDKTGSVPVEMKGKGEWKIREGSYPGFFLKTGARPNLKVKPRTIRIFQDGKEVDRIRAAIRFEEEESYPLDLRIEMDRTPGEEVSFSTLFEGEEGISILRKNGTVTLEIRTLADLPEAIGKVRVTGTVSGEAMTVDLPVEIRYTDRKAKLFRKYLPHLIALAAILLLLTAFLMLHRFGERQLWVYKEGSLVLSTLLRDWKRGPAGRKAFGTDEKNKTLLFKMHGMKGFGKARCTLRAVGKTDVYHASEKIKDAEKRPVTHGEEILLSAGMEEWYYFYFDRTPTEEEILSRQKDLEDQDELFLEDE